RLRQWNRQTSLAVAIAGLTGLWLIIATTQTFRTLVLPPGALDQPLGTPRAIGQLLFSDFMLPFEIASLILLAAMVGAIFLARETALEEERAGTDVSAPEPTGRPQSGRQLVHPPVDVEDVVVPLPLYLAFGALLFAIGVVGVLTRRNAIIVLMSIELMLNATNLTLISFSHYLQ